MGMGARGEAALAADRDQFQNEMVEEQAQFERDVAERMALLDAETKRLGFVAYS